MMKNKNSNLPLKMSLQFDSYSRGNLYRLMAILPLDFILLVESVI